MIGLVDLLMMSTLGDNHLELVKNMQMASTMLLSVVNDILDISKVNAGKMVLAKTAINLHSTPHNVFALFTAKMNAKGLTPVISVQPLVPDVMLGDPTRVLQILSNLVSNAIKFNSEPGPISISISMDPLGGEPPRVEPGPAGNGPYSAESLRVYFQVRDTGKGMSAGQQERLFQPFYQCEDHMARSYEGTGLGLSIVRSLVQLMGGSIGVQSTLGQGSTFTFDLFFDYDSAPSLQTVQSPPRTPLLVVRPALP